MTRLCILFAGALLAASVPASAQDAATRGATIFKRQCAPCHGQGVGDDGAPRLPGTNALQRKYNGVLPPALEKRGDLTADVIRAFVRHGSGAMPMFRKSELTDADIDAIAAYLKASAAQ